MVLFNYSTRELTAKIVYYGPGLCGKTTNLQYVHSTLPDNVRGKMLSLATKTDRTLFFDFLPIDLGQIRGMKTRVQLYTVPGQVFYNETRKLVLKGADGIVFVADSQATMLGANIESFKNLEENLKAHGMNLSEMPHVLQFNKRDLPKLSSIEELNAAINRFNAPFYESVATTGIGVQDTLKAITKLVLLHLTRKYDPKTAASNATASVAKRAATGAPPMEPETPAAPPPSPSATMQMPAVDPAPAAAPSSAVPLSNSTDGDDPFGSSPVEDTGAVDLGGDLAEEMSFDEPDFDKPETPQPAEPSFDASPSPSVEPSFGEPEGGPAEPSFGDQEIQDLVDEVQQTSDEFEESFQGDDASPPWDQLNDTSSKQEKPLAGEAFDAAPPAAEKSEAVDGAPTFEIDHGVDPEWHSDSGPTPDSAVPPSAEEPSPAMDSGQAWDLGSMDEPAAEPPPLSSPPGRGVDLPTLTEVVDDRHLFDPESFDVTRLAEGDEREIVVPVEVAQPDRSVRRYKLSIRLRMDPIR